jgi:long-chain acyl-CoA synthetase
VINTRMGDNRRGRAAEHRGNAAAPPFLPRRSVLHHNSPMPRDTLLDFFADLGAARGDFLVYDDGYRARSHAYHEVVSASRAFAARLQRAGIRKGDHVVFWSENRPEWIAAFWGALLAGAIAVPVDYRASLAFLQRVRERVGARIVLAGAEVECTAFPAGTEVWRLTELDWAATDAPVPVAAAKDDVAEIIFTSGATADPKGVIITHRNILANVVPVEREILAYRKYGKPFFPLRFLNLLPLSHLFGQAMATFIPPLLPGTVVFMRGYNPNDIVRQIAKRRVSVLVSVPKILDVLRDHVGRNVTGLPERIDAASRRPAPKGGTTLLAIRNALMKWWRYRDVHRLFGYKFWSFVVGAAPLEPASEEFWSRLGFVVVQGYGLTETAPIVSLNHPFHTSKGSVGKAIAGVDVRIAEDGEILVRGENVTRGYYGASDGDPAFDAGGWFHTGDVGEMDASGQLFIRGRKKEMIVTPEGLNVFPEDVEREINRVPGVRDSAIVGVTAGGQERVHAVLLLDAGVDPQAIIRTVNARLEDHQKVRGASVWPAQELPRTEGTRKLKRKEIQRWVQSGGTARPSGATPGNPFESILARYARDRGITPQTTIDELGLSSLERVELMVELEDTLQTTIDERAFGAASTLGDLRQIVERAPAASVTEPVDFPTWNRRETVRLIRSVSLATWILPLARVFAWVSVRGREHIDGLHEPVIFAANHQSHFDVPVIFAAMPSRFRYRTAPAMAKEFFKAHFFPDTFTWRQRFTNGLNYYLAAFFFNAFPLPQREAGARQTLRYVGDLLSSGYSVLIFPEGSRTEHGEIKPFRPGIGMMGARLQVPVVPVRIEGADRVLHHTWKMAKPGRVSVRFGRPLRLQGEDYQQLAARVEEAVRAL